MLFILGTRDNLINSIYNSYHIWSCLPCEVAKSALSIETIGVVEFMRGKEVKEMGVRKWGA